MGGSTNTILHLLAIAQEAGIDFTMADIDRLSRVVPQLCKVAPDTQQVPHRRRAPRRRHHGHPGRAGPRRQAAHRCAHRARQDPGRGAGPVGRRCATPGRSRAQHFYMAGPAGIPTQVAFSQNTPLAQPGPGPRRRLHPLATSTLSARKAAWPCCSATSPLNGCVVKTAGVDESILVFEGPAHVTESQDEAVANILADKVKAGDVVIVRYEGPKGGPGMQEMLYPTSYIKSKGLGKACALLTDGRFSGGTSGLSIGHCLARSGRRRRHRPGARRRPHPHRHPQPQHQRAGRRRRAGPAAVPSRTPRAGSPPSPVRARCRPL